MKQTQKILDHFKFNKTLTVPQVMRMGIANHTARISEIRVMGYTVINTKIWNKRKKAYDSSYTLSK